MKRIFHTLAAMFFRESPAGPPWVDEVDSESQLDDKLRGTDPETVSAVKAIWRNGYCIVQNAVPAALCDQVNADYDAFVGEYGRSNASGYMDAEGRDFRLANLHLRSDCAMRIGMTPGILAILDVLFAMRTAVYTSLYFKFGTQQRIHLDTPFFMTSPLGYFAGVWTALEDVHEDAGPLEYYGGAHKLFSKLEQLPPITSNASEASCLEDFFSKVEQRASGAGRKTTALIKKGDTVIWHHALPHGGQKARNLALTRRSIVFHVAPENVQVHDQKAFFRKGLYRVLMPPKFGFLNFGDRKFATVSGPKFMK